MQMNSLEALKRVTLKQQYLKKKKIKPYVYIFKRMNQINNNNKKIIYPRN